MFSGDFRQYGYGLIDGPEPSGPRADFDSLLADAENGSRRIPARLGLVQILLDVPEVSRLVSRLLGAAARPVRAIAFDKTAGRNWAVPWHQDRTIAVDRRSEVPGVRCWTVKNGVDHCEPPVDLLKCMATLRWHLDAVGSQDGGIRVLPGTHRMGRLSAADIRGLLAGIPAVDISVPAGMVLVMSPLLVHSSRKRMTRGRRRVLHVELAADDPPAPLRWAWA